MIAVVIAEEDCDMELAEDEKEEVLLKLGEPPYSCYNLYFITIKNNDEENYCNLCCVSVRDASRIGAE